MGRDRYDHHTPSTTRSTCQKRKGKWWQTCTGVDVSGAMQMRVRRDRRMEDGVIVYILYSHCAVISIHLHVPIVEAQAVGLCRKLKTTDFRVEDGQTKGCGRTGPQA